MVDRAELDLGIEAEVDDALQWHSQRLIHSCADGIKTRGSNTAQVSAIAPVRDVYAHRSKVHCQGANFEGPRETVALGHLTIDHP